MPEINKDNIFELLKWFFTEKNIWVTVLKDDIGFYSEVTFNSCTLSFKYGPEFWYSNPEDCYLATFSFLIDSGLVNIADSEQWEIRLVATNYLNK